MNNQTNPEHKLAAMRQGGAVLSRVLRRLIAQVKPHQTGINLDSVAQEMIQSNQAKPAFKGYQGYPNALCVSINSQIVHGIPNNTPFAVGDIISLDLGVLYDGYFTDAAVSVIVTTSGCQTIIDIIQKQHNLGFSTLSVAEKLLLVTYQSLEAGIKHIKAGARTGDIGAIIQNKMEHYGFGGVRDLVGHGVGESIHQEPSIPNYGSPGKGTVLKINDTIAVEPMVTVGNWHIVTGDDHWTISTKDGSLAAHFEHTVAVLDHGAIVLTPWDDQSTLAKT